MFMGHPTNRWKIWLLAGSLPLLQLATCTPEQQAFWQNVQSATDTMLTGLITALFAVIQNRSGDDVVGVDTVAWTVRNLASWWC